MHFKYDFCPVECVRTGKVSFDSNRFEFCGDCERKKKKESFRKKYEAALAEILPGENYPFNELLTLLHAVRMLENAPADKLTVKDALLLSVYQQSENTFDKEKSLKK